MASDLHRRFAAPEEAAADDIAQFLRATERLPGVQRIRGAMSDALPADLAGCTLADLGCGPGWETERLAAARPESRVIGVDHNETLIEAARKRTPNGRPEWVCADITQSGCEPGTVDIVRTERVLMYLPDLRAGVEAIVPLLSPRGRIITFELDYGGTVLAPGTATDAVLEGIQQQFEAALPQPWAGRRLPGLLHHHGLVVNAEPFIFSADHVVWRRIVRDTITNGVVDGALDAAAVVPWLTELDDPSFPGFRAFITGVLTTAMRP